MDHQIVTHTAQLDDLGVAQKAGSTTKRLLIESGHSPAAAHRTMRSVDALRALPALARHAADGRLSAETVDAIIRGMTHIEKRCSVTLSDEDKMAQEIELLGQALSGATPTQLLKHARPIGNTLVDATDAGLPAADDSSLNTVITHVTDDGRIGIRADLTQVVGEKFLGMIDERSCPQPEPDGADDRRTAEQRRADAFELILDGEGVPLQMGHTRRLFPSHLRKAVIVRDQCCIKCGAPPSHTQVHHIKHWADGGATDLDNGCLLCQRCHTQVHHHGWDVVMGFDRHPWLVPPATIDPHRRPLPAYNRRTMRLDDAA